MTYEYEVLLFGSNRSRADIGVDLTERGRAGWRVVSGQRTEDGNWSFVIERAAQESSSTGRV